MMESKVCKRCTKSKPVDAFPTYKKRNGQRALRASCRDCLYSPDVRAKQAAYMKDWQARNAEARKNYQHDYYMQNREVALQRSATQRIEKPEQSRNHKREWKARNAEAVRDANSRWKKRNRDKVRSSAAIRRFRKSNATVGDVGTKELERLLRNPCLACGATENQTIEHMIPLARGGSHSIGNLTTLCMTCNASKGSLTWTEWRYSSRPRAREVFAA